MLHNKKRNRKLDFSMYKSWQNVDLCDRLKEQKIINYVNHSGFIIDRTDMQKKKLMLCRYAYLRF